MNGRIYCGRLPSSATEKDLDSLLRSIGKIRDIDFKEGYAYAVFKDHRDADKAVSQLNGQEFMGENILVERAKDVRNGVGGYTVAGGYTARVRQPKPPPVRTNHRIRVENLPTRAKWSELKEFMSLAGDVTFADTHRRRPGEGVVEFATKEDMICALETLDKHEFLGRKIRLIKESPRSTRDHSQSRSRSLSPPKKRRRYSTSPSPSRPRVKQSLSHERSESPQGRRKRHSHSVSPSRQSRRSRSESNHKSSLRSHRRRSHSKSPRSSRHKSRSRSRSKEKSKYDRHSSSSGRLHKKKKKHRSRSRSRSNSPRKHRS